jgi:D-3-phosphoglycerate dehydrogenase / 2-oxoglutarate reductase
MAGGPGGGHGVVVTGPLPTVVVGDALLPTGLMVSALEALDDGISIDAALDFGRPDEAELDRLALRLEREGPEAVPAPDDLWPHLPEAEALVVHYCPVGPAVLERAGRLRLLATCRAGTENLAVDEAKRRGILVVHVVGRTTEAVSDFAVALLLAEARNVARAHCRVARGGWDKRFANSAFTPELEGKTVGIVGFGEIGSAVARKLRGFRVRLLAHDPFVASDRISAGGAEPVDLGRLLEESDFVTLHARPEPGAPPLIGRAELGRMRPTAILVNTARAALLDTEALVDALASASLGGAALDVHDAEPLGPDHPLLGFDNVTLTPHLASSTKECVEKSPRLLVEDLRPLFRGGVPAHALNPEVVGDGWTGGGTR